VWVAWWSKSWSPIGENTGIVCGPETEIAVQSSHSIWPFDTQPKVSFVRPALEWR
jgi:hypothetical protein